MIGTAALAAMLTLATLKFSDTGTEGHLPTWSPDGQTIAHVGYDQVTRKNTIELMNAGGTNNRTLVNTPTSALELRWSTHGQLLAYTTFDFLSPGVDICNPSILVTNALTGATRLLDKGNDLAWSPSGQLLAYSQSYCAATTTVPGIYVINASGRGKRLVTDIDGDIGPAWSTR